MIGRGPGLVVLAISSLAIADRRPDPDELPEPPLEVVRDAPAVELPANPFAAPPGEPREPEVPVTAAPPPKPIDDQTRNVSVALLNTCNRAVAARRFDEAIEACRAAVRAWPGNHLAWYDWTTAALGRRDFRAALTAIAPAVALRPDRAMYQLSDGIARYEAAISDPARPSLDAARAALSRAVRLAPGLWRAHYYLGRIYRDRGDDRRAAEQLTQAIAGNPGYQPSYLALARLYRAGAHLDAALAVALRGTERVRATESADLWVEAGAIYDVQHLADRAIAAFSRALELRPRDAGARFLRGQAHAHRGDFTGARSDLDDVARSTDPALGELRDSARDLLRQIADAERESERPPRAGAKARRLVTPKATQP